MIVNLFGPNSKLKGQKTSTQDHAIVHLISVTATYLDNLQTYLAKILAHKGAHIWLEGDFNLPGIDWQNENIKHNSQHTAECHQLLDISKHAFLDQLVLEPIRITETQSNTLDLFFTNNNTLVNQDHLQNQNYWTYEEIHTTENFKREQKQ